MLITDSSESGRGPSRAPIIISPTSLPKLTSLRLEPRLAGRLAGAATQIATYMASIPKILYVHAYLPELCTNNAKCAKITCGIMSRRRGLRRQVSEVGWGGATMGRRDSIFRGFSRSPHNIPTTKGFHRPRRLTERACRRDAAGRDRDRLSNRVSSSRRL